jgi:sterol 3beta-glucosyltransferase
VRKVARLLAQALNQGSRWEPTNELATFLEEGSPPVYIGFGSTAPDLESSRDAALAVLKALGVRGVLATGRSGMASPQAIEIEGAPHDWLFPRMAAVVHHGGAGTTAEGCAPASRWPSLPRTSATSFSGAGACTLWEWGLRPSRKRSSRPSGWPPQSAS